MAPARLRKEKQNDKKRSVSNDRKEKTGNYLKGVDGKDR